MESRMDDYSFEIHEIPETGLEYWQFNKQMKNKPIEIGGFLHYLRDLIFL